MSNLTLNPIVLTSVMNNAAYKGPLTSEAWNESEQAKILDLISLTQFINNVLIPMYLPLPGSAITGLQGSSIYGDTTDQTTLFFDQLNGQSLTIADSLRQINTFINTLSNQINSALSVVGQLQAQLNASNQYDISLALNNITTSVASLTSNQTIITNTIGTLQNKTQTYRSTSLTVGPNASESGPIVWPVAYPDNNYTVTISCQGTLGKINTDWIYSTVPGHGITITLYNSGTSTANVIVNVIAVHD